MSDPYRSEDPVAKLQAEKEQLQQQYNGLMLRYSALKTWPIFLLIFFGLCALAAVNFFVGRNTAPAEPYEVSITRHDRDDIAKQLANRVSRQVSASLQGDLRAMIRTELDRQNAPRSEQAPTNQSRLVNNLLILGQVKRGRIDDESGFMSEWWRFNALAGDTVIFRMKRVSGDVDPNLILYDPTDYPHLN